MEKLDLIIIGGGAGAFAAATRASELGARSAIVNAGLPLGGTCVNVGCVPSKLLLEMGNEYYYAQHLHFRAADPVKCSHPKLLDFPVAMAEKEDIVNSLRASNYVRVAEVLGFTVIQGRARFLSPTRVEVNGQVLEADRFIIATGSRPQTLPFKGIDGVHYITSREALNLPRLPKTMIVVGAGPLGLEFAQMYAHFGTQVTVLKRGQQILSLMEPEVASELQRCLEEEGITIHTRVDIGEMREDDGLKIVEAKVGTSRLTVAAEELLLATGVTPNSDDMGLEVAGVAVDRRGFVQVNDELRTSAPHIWAAGDVVGKLFLETVAAKEGYTAAGNALEGTHRTLDYDSVPKAVFTSPQVASVGLTEAEIMKRYGVCSCRTVEVAQVPKARAVKETRGLIKMVVHPESRAIVGVHMVAPGAADLIHEATLAVKFKLTVDDIIDTVHVFPTLSEGIKLVAQSFKRDITRMSCCVE